MCQYPSPIPGLVAVKGQFNKRGASVTAPLRWRSSTNNGYGVAYCRLHGRQGNLLMDDSVWWRYVWRGGNGFVSFADRRVVIIRGWRAHVWCPFETCSSYSDSADVVTTRRNTRAAIVISSTEECANWWKIDVCGVECDRCVYRHSFPIIKGAEWYLTLRLNQLRLNATECICKVTLSVLYSKLYVTFERAINNVLCKRAMGEKTPASYCECLCASTLGGVHHTLDATQTNRLLRKALPTSSKHLAVASTDTRPCQHLVVRRVVIEDPWGMYVA